MFDRRKKEKALLATCSGELLGLDKVPDEAFASGMLGKGFAIEPTDGTVFCPTDATLASVADGKHAYTLASEDGLDLLIHVGVDTVELGGNGFEVLASVGAKLRAGDVIARFSPDKIKSAGLCSAVITLVTDPEDLQEITFEPNGTRVEGGGDVAAHYRILKKG